jgi:RNA-directed DNA polymerase
MGTYNLDAQCLRNLAYALLSSAWTPASLRKFAHQATGLTARRFTAFVRRLLKELPSRPSVQELVEFLRKDDIYTQNLAASCPIWTVFVAPRKMTPPPAAAGAIKLPQLTTEDELANWLGVRLGKLFWYADTAGRNRQHPEGPLRVYRYRWIAKPGKRSRLLEIPKSTLKRLQRKILADILDLIPLHPATHGFRAGRSIVTNAGPHCGKRIVIRFDLAEFFTSVAAARIYRTFQTFGYPERVARLLTGLCTTSLPDEVWQCRPNPPLDGSDHSIWLRFSSRHLPQGAPTSPALANLAAFRLDRRLCKLAGALGADYTRYADDLTFSGGAQLAREIRRFALGVAVIVLDEGFSLNFRKTRIMRSGGRQQVAGIVVNVKPNIPRADYDRLKAILTNSVRHGPTAQNRDGHADFRAHLLGCVAQVAAINPARGGKLKALFDGIVWDT